MDWVCDTAHAKHEECDMAGSEGFEQKPNGDMYSVEDLVRLGNEVLQTLSAVPNVRMIRGCCTQGCCNDGVVEMLGRSPGGDR